MDYGFAPGNTGFDGLVRSMFTRRANTTLIKAGRKRSSVHDLIVHLDTTAVITKPIENILLGSHANAQGYLFTPMFRGQQGPTNFEILEDTTLDSNKSIEVPDSLIGYTDPDPITSNFHIKGCNIGKAMPFLTKMKEVLGDHIQVTAPLHFHGLFQLGSRGIWELMAHEFRLIRKNKFADRDALISELDAEGFTFYNDDPVTTADWKAWVPRHIDRTTSVSVPWPLGVTLDKRTTIPFNRQLRYKQEKYTMTISFPTKADVPSDQANRMTALETALGEAKYRETDTVGSFDSTHPYPEYERWGYTSLQNFIDEHDWKFSRSGKRLVCSGYFHRYTVLVPITNRVDPDTGNLIFNFYPKPGSATAAINTGLVETDPNFFTTV